jgi:hypothetical protein
MCPLSYANTDLSPQARATLLRGLAGIRLPLPPPLCELASKTTIRSAARSLAVEIGDQPK